jgi:uncharacterized protein (TIGR03083 family)
MERDPHVWIRALRHSQNRLASTVQPLSREQLLQPSYHSWTIAEVLSHLGSAAEIFQGWFTAALDRTAPPGQETNQPIWDAWNARGAEAQARDSLDINERLVRRFESLSNEELARIHLTLFGMPLDATGLARFRLGEHAVHSWDIAVALDPTAQVLPDAVALLIDTLSMLARFAGKPQDKEFRLRVRTREPKRDISLWVGGTVEISPRDGDGMVDGELAIPAEAFLRLVYGRLDPAHTPEVELTGSITLDDLRHVFPGV